MKLLLTTVLLIVFGVSYSQSIKVVVNYINNPAVDKSTIVYGKGKLTWLDFKGKPDYSVVDVAQTSSGIGYNYEFDSGANSVLVVNVYCFFSKKQSFGKVSKENNYILQHEQHHFDLSYIYSQLLIQRLKLISVNNNNYDEVVNNIYDEVNKELDTEQDKYDNETKHSTCISKQLEWDSKINSELVSLNNNGNLALK